jgi:phosphatidylethanolamine/phosphatidyl-N-methylethanolamine N-methyltransferase
MDASTGGRHSPIRDGLRFFRGMISNPARMGAVAPSGMQLARAMAEKIPADSVLPVLELGPGTGAITAAILERTGDPSRVVMVECEKAFQQRLAARFPGTRILIGDALDLPATLEGAPERYCAVVSGLPLLNFPLARRQKLLRDCMELLEEGGVFVQFSYGPGAPVQPIQGLCSHSCGEWLALNMPPARVHLYRRTTAATGGQE